MPVSEAAAEQESASKAARARFHGKRSAVFWMQARFMLLMVLTLGVYRFWAKTKTRRYFWGNAEIAGDRLEYVGTARELLIGFLIALAVLVPLYAVNAAAETVFTASPQISGAVAFASGWVFALLIQAALYRMWRYRLTRTAWRGIRFGMDGKTLDFVALSFMYWLLVGVTLGLAFPYMRAALARYRINNARFGDRHFHCDVSGETLIVPWLVVYLTAGLGFVWYLVEEFDQIVSCTRFGDSALSVDLRAGPFYGWLLAVLAALAVSAAVLVGLVLVGSTAFMVVVPLGADTLETVYVWSIFGIALFLLLGFSALMVTFVLFEAAKQICASLIIEDVAVFEEAVQTAAENPRHGEGFADALDAGSF